ncbi:hypothetical protein U1E44_10310 [Arenibacter sp. GZD96]|uniref:WapI family immunity protein n=1 Tax=Aurantibrevibacter litoralis TaxID=3106030 RepID=UPI002AFED69E|nr:hypothetical protein [Arenibacter sp. GZD-96]MEA1786484.1 hypothetical protein [Arenibacter sp. GZD-96]
MTIKSDYKHVKVKILKRLYPERYDFEDGNWISAEININLGIIKGLFSVNLRTDDFQIFLKELKDLQLGKLSIAKFDTMEEGIHLKGVLNLNGNIEWDGVIKFGNDNDKLSFKLVSDNMSLDTIVSDIENILKDYPVRGEI